MTRQLRMASMAAALAFAAMSALPAAAQGTFPSAAQEFSSNFWTERMMKTMDKNKDGMVSRAEYMEFMGAQYDMMDAGKKGMLTSTQFMDKKMMGKTFMFPASVSETGAR